MVKKNRDCVEKSIYIQKKDLRGFGSLERKQETIVLTWKELGENNITMN